MNAKMLAMFVSGGLLSLSCHAQGTFQNLGFESATVGPDRTPRTVSFASAFPGWTGYLGTTPASTAVFNTVALDASAIALLTFDSILPGFVPFAGNYTAVLQGGTFSFSPDVSLAQTGVVPVGAMSLRFFARSGRGNFIVSMDGQPLGVTALQDFGNYREYGADITAFAGQNAELRFTQPGGPNPRYDNFFLDQISFSSTTIPEPSTWALLALGSALLWSAARRRKKSC